MCLEMTIVYTFFFSIFYLHVSFLMIVLFIYLFSWMIVVLCYLGEGNGITNSKKTLCLFNGVPEATP